LTNQQLYLAIGIPSVLVVLSWLTSLWQNSKLDAKLDVKIDGLQSKVDANVVALSAEIRRQVENLDTKIQTLDAKLDRYFEAFNAKLDRLAETMHSDAMTLQRDIVGLHDRVTRVEEKRAS
jgi:hypothetical protein